MGVKLIRDAVCDICGKQCSFIEEKTYHEKMCEKYQIKLKVSKGNPYHYVEITSKCFDSLFGDIVETKLVLCGDCDSDLFKYLSKKRREYRPNCETCRYYGTDHENQPCCSCANGCNYEESEVQGE